MKPGGFVASGKLRAFALHLACSVAVVGVIAALMLTIWFPQPWFMHDGGWPVFRVILLVDVVAGPLLTLLVFRRGKPGLQRDLTVIVTLQLGALAFGVTTMIQYRPAFIVYGDQNFFTVNRHEVTQATKHIEHLHRLLPARGPGFVIQRLPRNQRERDALRAMEALDGLPLVSRGDYYDALTAADWQAIFARSIGIDALAREHPAIAADLERFQRRHPESLSTFAFVPVVCRSEVIMLVLDRRSLAIIDWLE